MHWNIVLYFLNLKIKINGNIKNLTEFFFIFKAEKFC